MKRLFLIMFAALMATKGIDAAQQKPNIKVWTQNANVANTLTTKKDKQKFEALLASAEAILNNQQVAQQKQRFNSNWKALNTQLDRAHWGVSPSAWLEGIAWRDRLVGIYTALEYILGQVNSKETYAENEKAQLIQDISELISKTSNELNK
jgi:hypothetical protein